MILLVPRGCVISFVPRGPRGFVISFCPERLQDFVFPERGYDFFVLQ